MKQISLFTFHVLRITLRTISLIGAGKTGYKPNRKGVTKMHEINITQELKMEIKYDILNLIGNTPLIRLKKVNATKAEIFAKLEFLNPSGSLKDRMALYMINMAEKKGRLKPDSTIVEATSGNTGIAFSLVGAVKGYRTIMAMPEQMTIERKQFMELFGSEVVLTSADEGIEGPIKYAEKMAKGNPSVWFPRQFENQDNIDAQKTMGKEIVRQAGKVDAFVAGVGTGGTLMGVAQALKEAEPHVKIIAVEPVESAVLSGGKPGKHQIQGIGAGFIPKLVDMDMIDDVIAVKSEDAINMAKRLAKEEGLFVGISSGACVVASLKVASKLENKAKVVTVLADSGNRYVSIFSE